MKVPEPRKLKSGTWFIQLRLGGQSIPVSAPAAKECKRQAALIKAEYLAGKRAAKQAPADMTLRDLMQGYVQKYRSVLSPSTVRGYGAIVRTRFLAYADRKIKSLPWQDMINAEQALCSPKTLANAWGLVTASLRDAKLPVPSVKLPQVPTKTRPWLPSDDIRRFLEAIEGEELKIPMLMGLLSLRRSEIMAVTWDKVDLIKKQIRVEGAVVLDDANNWVYKETNKESKSRRVVPIMIPALVDALMEVPEEKRVGRVVTCSPNSIYQAVNRVCKREGLSLVGVHGLRHSFASLGHHVGVPEQDMMLIGGWSDPGTMHKIYEHIEANDIIASQNAMSVFYTNANEDANHSKQQ